MGKLYDRRDLEFDLGEIDRLEQRVSANIANGRLGGLEAPPQELFDKERRRCRMRLLRTGQLMSDLNGAMRLFRRCPHCHEDAKGKQRACIAHRKIVQQAKSAVYWAGEENFARRAAAGQLRVEAIHDGACNVWEQQYFEDRRNGVWPGQSREELAYNLEQFESLGYSGWLRMMRFSAEEISDEDFHKELARLKGGDRNE